MRLVPGFVGAGHKWLNGRNLMKKLKCLSSIVTLQIYIQPMTIPIHHHYMGQVKHKYDHFPLGANFDRTDIQTIYNKIESHTLNSKHIDILRDTLKKVLKSSHKMQWHVCQQISPALFMQRHMSTHQLLVLTTAMGKTNLANKAGLYPAFSQMGGRSTLYTFWLFVGFGPKCRPQFLYNQFKK